MSKCTVFFLVIVPLLAVALYYCLQPVRVEVEVKTTIRSSAEKVFNFLKNPELAKDCHNKGLTDMIMLEYTPNVLDEKDGFMKDIHLTQFTQRLPLKLSVQFNVTWMSCEDKQEVETLGTLTGYDKFYSLESVKELKVGEVEVTRYNDLLVPRILAFVGTQRFTDYQHQIIQNVKEAVEKDGAEMGTQTD